MPRGNNVTLASGTGNLYKTLTGGDRATLLILNPNDGIVYVTINAQASPAVWDFIVPSQSRAYLPGPWLTYGLYFSDQSGAGHSGNITIFESDTQLLLPDYGSIGRALQAQVTTVDIVEGAQPANPPVGVTRLWSDNNGNVLALLANGTVEQFAITPANYGLATGITVSPAITGTVAGNIPDMLVNLNTNGNPILVLGFLAWWINPNNMPFFGLTLDSGALQFAFNQASIAAGSGILQITHFFGLFTGISAGAHAIRAQWGINSTGATLTASSTSRYLYAQELRA